MKVRSLWDGNFNTMGCYDKYFKENTKSPGLQYMPLRRPMAACKELVELSAARGTRDDISVMIVDLRHFCPSGWCKRSPKPFVKTKPFVKIDGSHTTPPIFTLSTKDLEDFANFLTILALYSIPEADSLVILLLQIQQVGLVQSQAVRGKRNWE